MPPVGQRILITGGSGFIGSHLITYLSGTDRTHIANMDIVPSLQRSLATEFIVDLCDARSVAATIKNFQPDIIFNLAACTTINADANVLAINTKSVENLIAAMAHLSSPPHLVHASTQLVVGPGQPFISDDQYSPYTPYGETKANSEVLIRALEPRYSWTIVRPSTVWGPGHSQFKKGLWRYIEQGLFALPSGIDPIRSYGYVGNVVYQLGEILQNRQKAKSKTLYLGDSPVRSSQWLDTFSVGLRGRPVRRVPGQILKVAAAIGEVSGRLGGPSPINFGRLYRMSTDYPVPMGRTFELLGSGPFTLSEGVDATVRWLRHQ